MTREPRQPSSAAGSRIGPSKYGWIKLGFACSVIAVVWVGLLPRLAERPTIRAEIEQLEDRQIDPSAMFYTELEALDRVLARLDRFHRDHPRALWLPGK